MIRISNKVHEMRNNAIPQEVASKLTETIMKIGMVRGQTMNTPYPKLLWECMLVTELRDLNIIQHKDYSMEEIIIGIYSDKTCSIKAEYDNLLYGMKQISQITGRFNVLPATDFIKIHELLKHDNQGVFEHMKIAESTEVLAEELWEILTPFYDEQSTFPKLLESILVCYQLDCAAISAELHSFCKELLINYGINKNFNLNFRSLFITGQLIRKNLVNKPLEEYVSYFLSALSNTAVEKGTFLFDLEDKMQYIEQPVCKSLRPNAASPLQDMLVLTNRKMEERLSVSPKTAIGYLKSLEEMNFVRCIKSGREKLYINELAYQLLQR